MVETFIRAKGALSVASIQEARYLYGAGRAGREGHCRFVLLMSALVRACSADVIDKGHQLPKVYAFQTRPFKVVTVKGLI